MSVRPKRHAFTLVELLVVIAIIGMLMALLLPAVNSAREAGRSNTCRNNMKQVSFAIYHYDKAHNRYPGFADGIASTAGNNQYIRRPLLYMILPYLERNDLYEAYQVVHLEWMVCPSNPETANGASAYVYNTGMPGGRDRQANGVFWNRWRSVSIRPNGGNNSSFISTKDGTTNTAMVTENMDNRLWSHFGEVNVGWVWHDIDATQQVPPFTINGQKGQRSGTSLAWARPSSEHPQSVNMAFCDNHVRTINQNIQYHVLAQIMTSHGRGSGPISNMNPNPRTLIFNGADIQ